MDTTLSSALPTWVLTFLMHSTLLFALAWSLERLSLARRLRSRETIWRIVLFGALVSASLQTLATREPWLGRHAFPLPIVGDQTKVGATSRSPVDRIQERTGVEEASQQQGALLGTASPTTNRSQHIPAAPISTRRSAPWLSTFATRPWFWLLSGASLAIGFILMPYLRIRRWLGTRRPVQEANVLQVFERLQPRGRPRLTVSDRILGPVTLGILRPEVCLPRRALDDLDASLLRAMLAHELAHLERRDPLWFALSDAVCRLLWFQPLLRRARARLVELAELACDQRAARRTQDPIALASCLTEVAGWLHGRPAGSDLACAMARPGSNLQVRVRRLLEIAPGRSDTGGGGAPWLGALAALTTTFFASATLPGMALQGRRPTTELRRAEPFAEQSGQQNLRPLLPSRLQEARFELSSSLATLEERIAGLHKRSLVPSEQRLLDRLSERFFQLERRHAALEADLQAKTHAETPSSLTDNPR